ncbi:alpha/beta hydrolase family protein [Chitinophaga niastensis]|uniref:Alpha/beta hydrolase family protein n=1 Tax=Chitinophaga niastensis TaxID=536980 RepID=A0A2P8HKE5_CHINA|nr:alpha/beta hydrolase [Chitinophaga niastensis]PSL46686.1 alpha/beta hydrolase family protein [Chitinophaga niastensis]
MQQQVLPLSLRMAGVFLSAMSRPFPGITARLFYRLYCTPPARKLRATHEQLRDTAITHQLQVTSYPFDYTPLPIVTYKWGNTGPKVLLLHGWGGSPFDFKQLITTLLESGYQVVTYDGPAHGASGGKRTNLVQWMHVLEQVIKKEGPLHAIVGHSFGGLNAALTLSRKNVKVPRLVMLGIALSAPVFFNDAFRLFRIHPVVMPQLLTLIHKRLKEGLEELDLYRYINKIKADKIWIAYDTTDTLAPATDIIHFLEQYPAIESLKITGDGHFRIARHQAVLEGIMQFLAKEGVVKTDVAADIK